MKNTRYTGKTCLQRVIALTIALVLCISLLPMAGMVDAASSSWDGNLATSLSGSGTADNPYKITTGAELAKLMYGGSGYAKLMNDIDLSAYTWVSWNFSGVLDGCGKLISGLRMGTSAKRMENFQYVGLVGKLSGTVKNVAVEISLYSEGVSNKVLEMGGIAGRLTGGTIDNCTVTGIIDGHHSDYTSAFGGIVGRADGGTIMNCTNRANVTGAVSKAAADMNVRVAGIVGQGNGSLYINNCVNYGNIHVAEGAKTASNCAAAGICVNKNTLTISNCVNIGSITKDDTNAATGVVEQILVEGGTATCVNTYYWDGSRYIKNGQDSNTFANDAALIAELNNNVTSSGSSAGFLTWVQGKDGGPVPGADILPRLIQGTLTISGETQYGATLTATITDSNVQSGLSYQWYRSTSDGYAVISGATGTTYTTTQDDIGRRLQIKVSCQGYDNVLQATTSAIGLPPGAALTDVDPIYIDCDAAQNGDGTKEKPYRTLEEARSKIREIVAETPTANLMVYLMGGTYVLDETFVLGQEESCYGRVTFKNYNDEEVVISGAQKVSGEWKQVSEKGYYSLQLPESAKVDGKWPAFRDLLVDGKMAQLAKSAEYIYAYNFENAKIGGNSNITSCDNLLYISTEVLGGITNANLDGVELSHLNEWKTHVFHIEEITDVTRGSEQQIKLNQEEFDTLLGTDRTLKDLTNRKYWLQNHIAFLDEPNEFYYDQDAGVIYYYPMIGQNMSASSFEYAMLDYLVEMENVTNITFDGITFTGTTVNYITEHGFQTALGNTMLDPAIGVYDAGKSIPFAAIHGTSNIAGIRIQNCLFTELAGSGIVLELGVTDLQVTGNTFKNIGLTAVQVGKNQRKWNENGILGASEDVTISNNYITNIGVLANGASGIKVSRCKNLFVQHNTIIHVPYSAIMVGYGWEVKDTKEHNTNLINADISYNYIEDFLYKINDGGAIYTCGANDFTDNQELFNEIHHNYIRAGAHKGTYTGVYHDGSASNWYTHHNVIDDLRSTKGPMFFQDDIGNQFTHNVTAANNYTSVSTIFTRATADRNIVLKDNVQVADRAALLAIPEAKAIIEDAGLEAAYAHIATGMDVALQIQDNSMHYEISDIQAEYSTIRVKLTNNYDTPRAFTLAVSGDVPRFLSFSYSGNGVELAPGESTVVTVTLVGDMDRFAPVENIVLDFVVTENTGKTTVFPRQFTFSSVKRSKNEIAYATPKIDGILDKAYLNSAKVFIGEPYATTGDDMKSTVEGRAYMLWDENYLYLYAIIHDETLMTRGMDFIKEKYNDGKGNPHLISFTDGIEAYFKTSHRDGKMTKFGIDAFGLQPFTQATVPYSVVDAMTYVTRFTYNENILDLNIQDPVAGQLAGTEQQPVDGYVVEIALPLTACTELKSEGKPQIGDVFEFYLQISDYTKDYVDEDGKVVQNIVSMKSEKVEYVLVEARPYEEPSANNGWDTIVIIAVCLGAVVVLGGGAFVAWKVIKKKRE